MGAASHIIHAYTITDEHYSICLQLLKTHYDGPREIIFTIIDKLISLNSITHVFKESLFHFTISVADITQNLQTLGIDLKACNSFITRKYYNEED